MLGIVHKILVISAHATEGTTRGGVVQRLGNVLYWVGTGTAVLIVICGVAAVVTGARAAGTLMLVSLIAAALIWGIGRAACYILSGR